jgi:hypothetical protein
MTRLSTNLTLAALGLMMFGGEAFAQKKPAPPPSTYERDAHMLAWDKGWKTSFPFLKNFEVLAPSTASDKKTGYNCIAHTVRVYTQWVWPGDKLTQFDQLYGRYGFRRIKGLDYRFDSRYEKIVLYAKVHSDGRLECTHGSRQLADGTWTSKLGAGPLIRHHDPNSVGGPSYGRPVHVYVRERKNPIIKPAPSRPAVASTAKPK